VNRAGVLAVLGIVALLVLALLAILFVPVEEEVEQPPSGMAAINRFYAAERLVSELGLPARTAWRLDEPPTEPGALVIVLDENIAFREAVREPLRDWVADGGRLLVAAPIGDEAPLLEAFGIYRSSLLEAEATVSRLPLGTGPAREVGDLPVWSVWNLEVTDINRWSLADEEGLEDVAISFGYGDGWIGAVGGSTPWTSDNIGDAENASFLWDIVQDAEPDSVLFVVRGGAPSLWSLLWASARTALISLAALLLAVAWRASRRFGPMLPTPSAQRRRIVEHIEGSGAFLWRQPEGREALIHSARRAAGHDPDDGAVPASAPEFIDEVRRHQAAWRRS